MSKTIFPASLMCDFYKISHKEQYPENTEILCSNWTPRGSRIKGIDKVVSFGFQAFIQKYLVEYFNENFFKKTLVSVIEEYERVLKFSLGVENPDSSHIKELHNLQYLPIQIKAIKEGKKVPMRVPMMTIENTLPQFFWITNYLETLMSLELWMPMTSATIANQYREILEAYAMETVGNIDAVQFQGHDFSMRGMAGFDAAVLSGMGHLLNFTGTDTIPAILAHEEYYGANIEKELVGCSIPATEHSVMCSYGKGKEFETYKRLITEVYPSGLVSIVSDTWDLWKVLDEIIKPMKDDILAREGKVVIRPDSGNPVDIICGLPVGEWANSEYERKGVIEILWDIFGGTVNDKGYKELDPHIGAIYGDAITIDRATEICEKLKQKGFASTNIVFGIGSFTYQYNTRDTFGFALKSTYVKVDGEERQIFKDPKTDDGLKKSAKGLVVVLEDHDNGELFLNDELTLSNRELYSEIDKLQTIFVNGAVRNKTTLAEIREEIRK